MYQCSVSNKAHGSKFLSENIDIASFKGLPRHQEFSTNKNKTNRQNQNYNHYHSLSSSELSSELSEEGYDKSYGLSSDKEESDDEGDVTLTPVRDDSSDTRTTVRQKHESKKEPCTGYPGFPSGESCKE
jgi:hypothetical protein